MYELIIANIQADVKQPEDMVEMIREAQSCLQFDREGSFEHSVKTKLDYMLQYLW